jgi:hypothetical protein
VCLGCPALARQHFRQESFDKITARQDVGDKQPKPNVVVPVVRVVVPAVRAANILLIIVESAPTQHAVSTTGPRTKGQGDPKGLEDL